MYAGDKTNYVLISHNSSTIYSSRSQTVM